MAATGEDLRRMDARVQQVRAVLERAEQWADGEESGVFSRFLLTPGQRAAINNIRVERNRFTSWSTEYRTWAERGTEPDGYPYTVAFWLGVGDDLESALHLHLKEAGLSSLSTVVGGTVSATAAQVGRGVERAGNVLATAADTLSTPWPTWAKLGAAGLGVVALFAAARRVLP